MVSTEGPRIRGQQVWLRALESSDLPAYWLTTETANARAQRAFEKARFRRAGTIRHHFRREGQWRDSLLMAVVREDWAALARPRSWELSGSGAGAASLSDG